MVYGHANGADVEDDGRGRRPLRRPRLQGDPRPERRPGPEEGLRRGPAAGCPTSRRSRAAAARGSLEHRGVPGLRAARCSRGCGRSSVPSVHLLHDVHHRLTPIEAARLGKELEPYRLFWLEDAVPAELQEGFRLIRQHTTTPLAVGEVFNTI